MTVEVGGAATLLAARAHAATGSDIPDARLQLTFACTHPAIGVGARGPGRRVARGR